MRDAAVAAVVAVVSVDDLGPVPRDGRFPPAAHTADAPWDAFRKASSTWASWQRRPRGGGLSPPHVEPETAHLKNTGSRLCPGHNRPLQGGFVVLVMSSCGGKATVVSAWDDRRVEPRLYAPRGRAPMKCVRLIATMNTCAFLVRRVRWSRLAQPLPFPLRDTRRGLALAIATARRAGRFGPRLRRCSRSRRHVGARAGRGGRSRRVPGRRA